MKPHPVLYPISLFYGMVVSLRNLFFDIGLMKSVDVGVPVISIGNITAGGTGKTPIVKNVAAILMEAGKSVAILSRGYGRTSTGTVVVCDGKNILVDSAAAGDEPLMIARHLKTAVVIVDENRVRGAKKAVEEFGVQVIILDDGFQHRRIKRTKDIVLMDAERMPYDTMLLPAGYRRELIGSLKRADAVVVTKAKGMDEAKKLSEGIQRSGKLRLFSSSFLPTGIQHLFGGVAQSKEILKGHTAVLFCGIADPESFRKSVESCGVKIIELLSFSDHHRFDQSEVDAIIHSFHTHKADYILTTEKDAVRLLGYEKILKQLPIAALTMDVIMHQQAEWREYILSVTSP